MLLISLIFTALASCDGRGGDNVDYIGQAEEALDSNRYDQARSLIDEHLTASVIDTMQARELARLSIVYMRMRDCGDEADTQGWAQRAGELYGRAIKADSVAARGYYNTVPAERVEYVQVMRQLYYAPQQHIDMEEPSAWDEHEHDHEHQH